MLDSSSRNRYRRRCSDASLAIAPILEQNKIVQLNAGSVTMKLTESGYKYVFRIFPNAEQQSLPLVKVAREKLKAQTAVILYEKTNAGIDNAEGFEKPFVQAGGKVLAKIDFGRDVNDFTSIATRIASLGKVDVLPTFALEGQQVRLAQALAQAKVVKGGGGPGVQMGSIWLPWGFDQKAGAAAIGYVRIVQFDPSEQRKIVQDFVKAFQAKYGADRTPTHINAHAYDTILLCRGGAPRRQGLGVDSRAVLEVQGRRGDHRQDHLRQQGAELRPLGGALRRDAEGPELEGDELAIAA